MIEYENLQKTNRIFLKKFKKSYKNFCKDGNYILSNNVNTVVNIIIYIFMVSYFCLIC